MLVWLLTGAICIGASIYGIYAANEQSERKKAQGKISSEPPGEEADTSSTKPRSFPSIKEKSRRAVQERAARKPEEEDVASPPQTQGGRHRETEEAIRLLQQIFVAKQCMECRPRPGHRLSQKRGRHPLIVHDGDHISTRAIKGFPEEVVISRSPSKSAVYKLVKESVQKPLSRRTAGRARAGTKKGVRTSQALAKAKA